MLNSALSIACVLACIASKTRLHLRDPAHPFCFMVFSKFPPRLPHAQQYPRSGARARCQPRPRGAPERGRQIPITSPAPGAPSAPPPATPPSVSTGDRGNAAALPACPEGNGWGGWWVASECARGGGRRRMAGGHARAPLPPPRRPNRRGNRRPA